MVAGKLLIVSAVLLIIIAAIVDASSYIYWSDMESPSIRGLEVHLWPGDTVEGTITSTGPLLFNITDPSPPEPKTLHSWTIVNETYHFTFTAPYIGRFYLDLINSGPSPVYVSVNAKILRVMTRGSVIVGIVSAAAGLTLMVFPRFLWKKFIETDG